MSAPLRAYRFATEQQWHACLTVQAEPGSVQAGRGISPFAPLQLPPVLHKSHGAFAPVVTRAGDVLWHDDRNTVHRWSACEGTADKVDAPAAIGCATRIVATSSGLWILGPDGSLFRFEESTFARLLAVELADFSPIDITRGGRGSIWALVKQADVWQAVRLDSSGRIRQTVTFEGVVDARAFVLLRRSHRFVVLAADAYGHQRLYWFTADGGKAIVSLPVAPMRAGFTADVLASDSSDRLFLGGHDNDACCGAGAAVLLLDADGNLLTDVAIDARDAPVAGIAAGRDSVFVAGARGLLQFRVASTVPDSGGQARCLVITPALFSPDREDGRRWLRVEATADLPEGTSLEVSMASTDDPIVRNRLTAVAADTALTASERAHRLLSEPEFWTGIGQFHGSGAGGASTPFSAKLFTTRDRFIWICVSIVASPGARLPRLTELAVLYPGQTLMADLPSIYQREESRASSFFRDFIGVLEATTQNLDGRISTMGSLVHPSAAPIVWLDFVARWLGIPWDDGLGDAQKRALVGRAADLAKQRGTRAGLELLLACLMDGTPRRYRVTDHTADFGFAIVGDASCPGSSLPVMLGGRTRWAAELDSRAVLGYMRLSCPGQIDDGVYQLAGTVRIEIAATASERTALQPWLASLIADMVPLSVRVDLRWVSERALRSDRLDDSLTLEDAPAPHLGTDAITGLAMLPEQGARLSAFGTSITTRLR